MESHICYVIGIINILILIKTSLEVVLHHCEFCNKFMFCFLVMTIYLNRKL